MSTNLFTEIRDISKQNISSLSSGSDNVYMVPDNQGSIQLAIDLAVAKGHDQHDPAIIRIIPDSSTGGTVSDVQFTGDVTIYDGIYLESQVPGKRVNINGKCILGSTALGNDPSGNANTSLYYKMTDMLFIADGGGNPLLKASTAVVTDLVLKNCLFNNTGTSAGSTAVEISSTSNHVVSMVDCELFIASGSVFDSLLTIKSGTHPVSMKHCVLYIVPGSTAEVALEVIDGSVVELVDCEILGRVLVGNTGNSTLSVYDSRITVGTSATVTYVVGSNTTGAVTNKLKFVNCHVDSSADNTITTTFYTKASSTSTLTYQNVTHIGASSLAPMTLQTNFATVTNALNKGTALQTAAFTMTNDMHNTTQLLGVAAASGTVITLPAVSAANAGLTVEFLCSSALGSNTWVLTSPASTLHTVFYNATATSTGVAATAASTTITISGDVSSAMVYVKLVSVSSGWHAVVLGPLANITIA